MHSKSTPPSALHITNMKVTRLLICLIRSHLFSNYVVFVCEWKFTHAHSVNHEVKRRGRVSY